MEGFDSTVTGQQISGDLAGARAPGEEPLHAGWPTLDELCRRYVERVLTRTRGNRTQAAHVLDVDRRTVSRIVTRAPPLGRRG
jgi:DNA-binding NtrC family response regulator